MIEKAKGFVKEVAAGVPMGIVMLAVVVGVISIGAWLADKAKPGLGEMVRKPFRVS